MNKTLNFILLLQTKTKFIGHLMNTRLRLTKSTWVTAVSFGIWIYLKIKVKNYVFLIKLRLASSFSNNKMYNQVKIFLIYSSIHWKFSLPDRDRYRENSANLEDQREKEAFVDNDIKSDASVGRHFTARMDLTVLLALLMIHFLRWFNPWIES